MWLHIYTCKCHIYKYCTSLIFGTNGTPYKVTLTAHARRGLKITAFARYDGATDHMRNPGPCFTSDFSPQLRDKIRNGKPGFEATCSDGFHVI